MLANVNARPTTVYSYFSFWGFYYSAGYFAIRKTSPSKV